MTIKPSEAIQQFGAFSNPEIAAFESILSKLYLQKHDFLLRAGEVCQTVYFLSTGSARQYCITPNNEEQTTNLFSPSDWVLDYQSFTGQKPAANYIQVCEASEVYALTVFKLHDLIAAYPSFFRLGKLLENAVQDSKLISPVFPPEERYRYLLATKPQFLQLFPLKHIASFLQMAPETLSRVRQKISSHP